MVTIGVNEYLKIALFKNINIYRTPKDYTNLQVNVMMIISIKP